MSTNILTGQILRNAFYLSAYTNRTIQNIYHLRGLARTERGDHEGALKDFGTAIDLDPDYGPAYYSRAMLQLELGREALPQMIYK